MKHTIRLLAVATVLLAATQASAQVTLYEGEGFRGRVFRTGRPVENFGQTGFNDRASSLIVERGSWEACEDAGFRGRCVLLRDGSYDSLSRMGFNDRISSIRPVSGGGRDVREAPVPLAAPTYEYRRRPEERLYSAQVTSVRAVVKASEQRCWVERERVGDARRGGPNVGGAVVGAILGGVLGHQIGGGTGKDIATVGGVLAGGAIGSQVGRDRGDDYGRDVQRCEQVPDATPEYWDVTYRFRDIDHHVQLSAPPGDTISVNRRGEPRL